MFRPKYLILTGIYNTMKKIILWISGIFLVLILSGALYLYKNCRNRHPGYKINISIKNDNAGPIKTGFAAIPITPEVPDRWHDKNNDAQYSPETGDTYEDLNGNGKFDAVWMAGFQHSRAANGVHDNLWARTMIIDDGTTRIAIVAIDAIGFMHDDIVDVRNRIPADDKITYTIIASTHTHEGPDLLGLWGKSDFKTGVDNNYMAFVKDKILESINTAVLALTPAKLIFSQDLESADSLVVDSRKPIVKDPGVRVMKAIDAVDDHTLGTLVSWGCHPEVLWSHNLLISSDFVNYVRDGIQSGIYSGDSLVQEGFGGVSVYINGCIGGLMTMDPDTPLHDPWSGHDYKEAGFDKARSLGYQVAAIAMNSIFKASDTISTGKINLVAHTITLPLANKLFRLGVALGVINRGLDGWMRVQSEIAAFSIGPATFITMPGEMYPEIVNGGIVNPPGADYSIPPVELPPIRDLMKGKYKFTFGLANDEIGYIIPQSEWDVKPPYLYNASESPYGEINSLGPETAPLIHYGLQEMLRKLQK